MRWGGGKAEISPEDLDIFTRITDPESPDFIADNDDYYAFFTYSLFSGTVKK